MLTFTEYVSLLSDLKKRIAELSYRSSFFQSEASPALGLCYNDGYEKKMMCKTPDRWGRIR